MIEVTNKGKLEQGKKEKSEWEGHNDETKDLGRYGGKYYRLINLTEVIL